MWPKVVTSRREAQCHSSGGDRRTAGGGGGGAEAMYTVSGSRKTRAYVADRFDIDSRRPPDTGTATSAADDLDVAR